MADYSSEVSTATELINQFGGAATLIKRGANTGTERNPTFGPDVTSAITIVDLSVQERDRAGTLTGYTTRTIYTVSALDKGDRIEINGSTHVIDTVSPLQPAPDAQVILYKATLER